MKHCHISIMANELPFLKQKLKFLYDNFEQVIFVDYDIAHKSNSKDGSIEYIENFNDPEKKIILIKDFNPNEIHNYNGVSFIDKQKMFAGASKYIKDDIDIVWATDLDEFFDKNLIIRVENSYKNDDKLISINIPHLIFVYNQYNVFNDILWAGPPRITKHVKGKIYGHCNFQTYGKTIKYEDYNYYHFAFVGYNRCSFKFVIYGSYNSNKPWLLKYLSALKNNKKHIDLDHPNKRLNLKSKRYNGNVLDYINIEEMIIDLNLI